LCYFLSYEKHWEVFCTYTLLADKICIPVDSVVVLSALNDFEERRLVLLSHPWQKTGGLIREKLRIANV
jgi:hypothetical protein